jgi:hypothetical protein
MKALLFLAACHSTPLPVRAPTEGIAPRYFPASWLVPAVLCVDSRLVRSEKWRCA